MVVFEAGKDTTVFMLDRNLQDVEVSKLKQKKPVLCCFGSNKLA